MENISGKIAFVPNLPSLAPSGITKDVNPPRVYGFIRGRARNTGMFSEPGFHYDFASRDPSGAFPSRASTKKKLLKNSGDCKKT